MILSRQDLQQQLKQRELAPVYLLFGPERYLRDRAAKAIANIAFAEGDFRDFNETSFSLNNAGSLADAMAAASQLPMMSTRRVVRITDVRISATGIRDSITEDDEPVLSAYLANPSPQTVIIMVADELNGVRKMGKFLREKTAAVEFARLDEDQLKKWAMQEMKNAGVEAEDVRYLLSRVGPDVSRLTNEIRKLAAAALPSTLITRELVDQLVPNTRELTNFELTDHLVAGRRQKAIAALRKILDDGAEPLALLGLISYNYRRLLMAKELMERGAERGEVIRAVKLPYGGQEPFLASARRSDMGALTRAVQLIANTDLNIKTSKGGSGPPAARMQIEMLVCELALM